MAGSDADRRGKRRHFKDTRLFLKAHNAIRGAAAPFGSATELFLYLFLKYYGLVRCEISKMKMPQRLSDSVDLQISLQ